jgi:hypothetical protein
MWDGVGFNDVDKLKYINFEKQFRANPREYANRLLPTFDLVVINAGPAPVVLTDIEVVVSRSYPAAQGDGEDSSTASHIMSVLYRYDLNIPERPRWTVEPFRFSVPATPPLTIQASDRVRFQLSVNPPADAPAWLYEMCFKLHFGSSQIVSTEKFRLAT